MTPSSAMTARRWGAAGLAPEHVGVSGHDLQDARSRAAPGLARAADSLLGAGDARPRQLDDLGSATIDQLALARLLETAAYDRHLRKVRRRNRARRDALIAAVARELPRARVSGISAGCTRSVRLPTRSTLSPVALAAARSVARVSAVAAPDRPAAGHRCACDRLREPRRAAIQEGIRRLAAALAEI